MKFPQYVSSKERTVSVVGYLDKKNETKEECINKYKDGKGYIDDDEYIWSVCHEKISHVIQPHQSRPIYLKEPH